jgi:AraC-like DNA-binding protein
VHSTAGVEIGQPGDCLVVAPGTPQYHCSVPQATSGFRNDWLYTDFDWLPERVAELQLPLNTRIATGRPALIRHQVQAIRQEQIDDAPLSHDFLRLHVDGILLAIARGHRLLRETPRGIGRYRDSLLAVRRLLYDSLEQPWTVPEMAERVGLGRNRFTTVYRQCFGVSPHADLQEARLREAANRLLTRDESIGEIAAACGFANVYYFSRAFRHRHGCPPSAFGGRRGRG